MEAPHLVEKYENLTKPGSGCIKSMEAKLELNTDHPHPVYMRARPVAHAMIPLADEEFNFMERYGVIDRVDVSKWAHPLAVVPRAGKHKVRICGNFEIGINRYLKIDEHLLKNIRDALDNIGNGIRFSKLDIRAAFPHMPIRESDRDSVVINTHRGLFRLKRMPNGLSNASAIWQRSIEGVLANIDGVECVLDDILITGKTDEEHMRYNISTRFSQG